MSHGRYILIGQTPVPCEDLVEWGRWMEGAPRRVRLTQVGPHFVSTIFLGLDRRHFRLHKGPPLLFETMAWIEVPPYKTATGLTLNREWDDDIQERCSTWMEAEAQHERVVRKLRQPGDPVKQIEPPPLEEIEASSAPASNPSART